MKKNLLLLGLALSGSIAAHAQLNLSRPTVTTSNHNGIERIGTTPKPAPVNSEKAVTCTDEVTYTQDGNIQATDVIQVGGTQGWACMFQVYPVFTGQVTQVEFKASSLGATALPVQLSIHAINASNEPIGAPIGSVNVSVGTAIDQYSGTFTSPVSVTDGFAIALWDPNGVLTDSLAIFSNPDGTGNNEGYSFVYHPDVGLLSAADDFGANINFPFLPTIKFDHADPTISATGSTTICEGTALEVDLNNGGALSHYNHPVYNPDGLGYSIDFGDGTTPATTASASHTYAMSGNYTVEGTTTYLGWNAQCTSSPASLAATIQMAPTSFFSYDATGLSVAFNSLSVGETTYSWNFGDGGTASSPSPIHNYATDGTYTVELTVTGPCGSDLYFKNITIATGQNGGDVGIEEQDGMHFAIAPNPSSDIVEVAFELNEASDVLITLFSTDGKRIEQKSSQYNAEGNVVFDLSSLNAGVYFLDIQVNDKKITKQVVKL